MAAQWYVLLLFVVSLWFVVGVFRSAFVDVVRVSCIVVHGVFVFRLRLNIFASCSVMLC